MAKDPAVLFYTSDFLTGTAFMSDEQRGQYIRLLCEQHQLYSIPEKHMISICGSLDSPVASKFIKDDAGNYYNPRMREEALKRANYCKSRSSNRRSGSKKPSSYDYHMSRHMENENENENRIRNEVNQRARGLVTIDSKAEAIYQHYPRKVGKKAAIKAIAIALKKTPVKVLEERVRLYSEKVAAWPEEEKQFIPHPATWFNQERWEDNDSEWERKKQKPKHQSEPSAPVTYLN